MSCVDTWTLDQPLEEYAQEMLHGKNEEDDCSYKLGAQDISIEEEEEEEEEEEDDDDDDDEEGEEEKGDHGTKSKL
ncbi:unnamed protein product [Allacma fusca]|uniref:Uncharacterized protein n=1 Tax=Allacma fusca TaxID=39272 RepID=A0A8J2KQI6_9HEXA|nr:unnamed protein product [Allacma fusca]